MLVLRFIGALFLLGAVIALTADFSRGTPNGHLAGFSSLLKLWHDFAPTTLAIAQKTVQTRTHPLVWSAMIQPLLAVPAWITMLALAAAGFYLGRPRRRVEIFIN